MREGVRDGSTDDGVTLLRARGLSLAYDAVVVLSDVDLDLSPGELVVVTGEDGCGTSSLLRALAGVPAADGVVEGGPTALLAQPPGDDWAPYDVAADLLDAAGLAVLEQLGAAHLASRELWTLSGGERQRVRLARALGNEALVLLLDEPLGYLDGGGARTVLEALRAHAAAGRSVLAVAKGDPRAAAAADRVLLLDVGRLSPAA